MNILVIDTSCKTAMVALIQNGIVVSAMQIHDNKTHSIKMLPAIEYILDTAGIEPNELNAIAVTNGPGSYTGLRIGVTTAKTFAYTLNVPLLGINTLEALAASCDFETDDSNSVVCPMIDARNSRVYVAIYKNGKIIQDTKAMECGELCDLINDLQFNKVVFVGDGAIAYKQFILDNASCTCVFVPTEMSCGNPTALAHVAYEKFYEAMKNGSLNECTADGLKVNYYKNYTDSI